MCCFVYEETLESSRSKSCWTNYLCDWATHRTRRRNEILEQLFPSPFLPSQRVQFGKVELNLYLNDPFTLANRGPSRNGGKGNRGTLPPFETILFVCFLRSNELKPFGNTYLLCPQWFSASFGIQLRLVQGFLVFEMESLFHCFKEMEGTSDGLQMEDSWLLESGLVSFQYSFRFVVLITLILILHSFCRPCHPTPEMQANPYHIQRYPVFRLSDGLFASKLGLEFRVEAESTGGQVKSSPSSSSSSFSHRYNGERIQNRSNRIKKYRIKCGALMEKNIHSSHVEVQLGTAKHSSGLHLSDSSSSNGSSSPASVSSQLDGECCLVGDWIGTHSLGWTVQVGWFWLRVFYNWFICS